MKALRRTVPPHRRGGGRRWQRPDPGPRRLRGTALSRRGRGCAAAADVAKPTSSFSPSTASPPRCTPLGWA
uniref:Uncharacterized protein n=1 Tax=Aegilops tauschii subsp. strangulata TaxID=200361 RepID=A0A453BEP6_AEGTS